VIEGVKAVGISRELPRHEVKVELVLVDALDHGGKIDVDASRWGGARFVIELRIEEGA
jgi:hypothetical protein